MVNGVDITLSVLVIIVAGVGVAFGYLARNNIVTTTRYQSGLFDGTESGVSWATLLLVIGVINNIIIVILLFLYGAESRRYGSSRGVRWLTIVGAIIYLLAAVIFAYVAYQLRDQTANDTEIANIYRNVLIAAGLAGLATILMIIFAFVVRRDGQANYPSEYPTFAYQGDRVAQPLGPPVIEDNTRLFQPVNQANLLQPVNQANLLQPVNQANLLQPVNQANLLQPVNLAQGESPTLLI